MSTTTIANPTTDNPCPPWWDQPAGHGYDSLSRDGRREARGHCVGFGTVRVEHDPRQDHAQVVDVYIEATEEADPDRGTSLTVDTPLIALSAECAYLMPGDARRVAAMLMAAADKLDEIVRGSRRS